MGSPVVPAGMDAYGPATKRPVRTRAGRFFILTAVTVGVPAPGGHAW